MAYKSNKLPHWGIYTSPKISQYINDIRNRISKHLTKKYPKVKVSFATYDSYEEKYLIVIESIYKQNDLDEILKYLKRVEKESAYFMKSSILYGNRDILVEIG